MMRSTIALLGCALGLLCEPNTAIAQSEEAKREAQRLKDEAFRYFGERDFASGIEAMEAAFELVPHPDFLFNIGAAYEQWEGHCGEAIRAFERFFEACDACETRGLAEVRTANLRKECEATVKITSEPLGAAITVDGSPRGIAPLELTILPGSLDIRAEAEDHEPATRTIRLAEGARETVHLVLAPVARTSAKPRQAPAAARAVTEAPLDPDTRFALIWSGLGVGAAGLITGTTFTVLTLNDLSAEERARQPPVASLEEIGGLRSDAKRDAVLAQVGFGVGVVGLAAAAVLYFAFDGDELPAFAPEIGPGAVGFNASGTF